MLLFRSLRLLVPVALALNLLLLAWSSALADEADTRSVLARFATAKGFSQVEKIIDELAATGDPAIAPALNALSDGNLVVTPDGEVVITADRGGGSMLLDPLTLEEIGPAAGINLDKVKIKNSIRRQIAGAISGLTLRAQNPATRLAAAENIFTTADEAQREPLLEAIEAEDDPQVRARMEEALASIALAHSDKPQARVAALETIAARGDRAALSLISAQIGQAEGEVRLAAERAMEEINANLARWGALQNVWYGLSLGSVLFLAAIGLAITFGVMGVINMAHGEMVMLGAYTTFVVQQVIRMHAPDLFDYSLFIALPLAFVVAGFFGLVIERGIIRFLYGRPLETLLATWGVSLILQQMVRTIFGPTNREVGNPSWMSGAFEIGQMAITWNRLWIIVFALIVFVTLLVAINRSQLGLYMRAVTQNRRMAAAMGIRTPWVDAMTFALGSGIAGIAGVALSQIDNVSPNLGQGYIIDSFMVVVFGGVGNLWGTLVGAVSLGIVNKFLEPYTGAVLGKIFVLVAIILFIQRRPRGLFAIKGRAVEQ